MNVKSAKTAKSAKGTRNEEPSSVKAEATKCSLKVLLLFSKAQQEI